MGPSRKALRVEAVAGAYSNLAFDELVKINNEESDLYTVINVKAESKPGLLNAVTGTIMDLGLVVAKAEKSTENDDAAYDKFYVTDYDNKKVYDREDLTNIRICVASVISKSVISKEVGSRKPEVAARPLTDFRKENIEEVEDEEQNRRSELLYSLMDTYIKNDIPSIQSSIVNHVEYTIARSRYRFDDFEAYQATALSVRDRLIESWNDTQKHFREKDPKRVYYLSMEFLTDRKSVV